VCDCECDCVIVYLCVCVCVVFLYSCLCVRALRRGKDSPEISIDELDTYKEKTDD